MSQQSIFGRIAKLARADVDMLVDQADDPQKMLDQLLRDYIDTIGDAEGAAAVTIGSLRVMEEDAREEQAAAAAWHSKAVAASQKADDMRVGGSIVEADKFDDLARIALRKQIDDETAAHHLAEAMAEQMDVVERLRDGLAQMQARVDELRRKRDELTVRAAPPGVAAHRAGAQHLDVLDPAAEIARFEDRIRREEERLREHADLTSSALDAQFEGMARRATDTEVEARLAAMKAGDMS